MNETASPPASKTSLKRSRELYKKKDRATVADHHCIVPEHPVLDVLLAFCVEYGLDPLGGHVWLVDDKYDRGRAENGEPTGNLRAAEVRLDVGITRDGLLHIANGDPRFEGMEFDVVRARDTFKAKRDGGDVHITHEYPDLPDADGEGKAGDYRSEIIGAYCKTFVKGRKPTYYFAFLAEHGQFDGDDPSGTWGNYQSLMIIKSAQSPTLRLGLGVSGVVGLDEIKRGDGEKPVARPEPKESPAEFIAGLDLEEGTKTLLTDKVEAANEAEPNSWSLAKLRMRLGMTDKAALEEAVSKTVEELDQQAERVAAAA
jgi:hypothetical protein